MFQAEPAPALWVPAPSHGCETCLRSGRDPTFPPASLRQSFYCCLFSSCPAQSLDLSLCFIPQNPPPREQGAGVFMLRSRMLGLILPCTHFPLAFTPSASSPPRGFSLPPEEASGSHRLRVSLCLPPSPPLPHRPRRLRDIFFFLRQQN